jgi:outer membrane receptor protein involved in Fe transport/DNA-binding XRE family transcriptional regulator
VDLKPLFGDNVDRTWQPQPFTKALSLASLTLDWDLGWSNFVSATGVSQTDTMTQLDSTIQFGGVADMLLGLPDPGSSNVRYTFDMDKVTQEFRFSSKSGGPFEWMVGFFYTKEDAVQSQLVWLGQLDGSSLPSPYDSFSTLANLALPSTYKETAVFANGSWRVGERFKIDAGLRQARNEQWFSQNVSEGILVPIADTPGESSEDVFTWSLSPQFKLGDDSMVYARVATGYQPGGPNVALEGIPPQVDSSMLISYELGLKSQFADQRMQLDVAAFRIDWDDVQVASSFNGVGGLVNGGEATSQGVELSGLFRATDNWTIGFNAAYTDAKVKNDFDPTVIPQGAFDVILYTGLAGDRGLCRPGPLSDRGKRRIPARLHGSANHLRHGYHPRDHDGLGLPVELHRYRAGPACRGDLVRLLRRRILSDTPMKNRLKVLRAERDWSQADLADRLEVSRQSVNAIETGKYDPSLPLAFRIARLFDLTIEQIFSED